MNQGQSKYQVSEHASPRTAHVCGGNEVVIMSNENAIAHLGASDMILDTAAADTEGELTSGRIPPLAAAARFSLSLATGVAGTACAGPWVRRAPAQRGDVCIDAGSGSGARGKIMMLACSLTDGADRWCTAGTRSGRRARRFFDVFALLLLDQGSSRTARPNNRV